jgi:hypothetical protein
MIPTKFWKKESLYQESSQPLSEMISYLLSTLTSAKTPDKPMELIQEQV